MQAEISSTPNFTHQQTIAAPQNTLQSINPYLSDTTCHKAPARQASRIRQKYTNE
jgi:hypothetical protein